MRLPKRNKPLRGALQRNELRVEERKAVIGRELRHEYEAKCSYERWKRKLDAEAKEASLIDFSKATIEKGLIRDAKIRTD